MEISDDVTDPKLMERMRQLLDAADSTKTPEGATYKETPEKPASITNIGDRKGGGSISRNTASNIKG